MEDQTTAQGHTDPVKEILAQQCELNDNVQVTAKLLRFALEVTNNNLMAMREQLDNIRRQMELEEGRPRAGGPGGG